jgi:peptidoglycan/LPS O-acetylase OafA/YrhL
MARQSTQSRGPAYLPALTGIRAFAAVMVLLLHTSQNFPTPLSGNALVDHGYLGVDLFFILSGFIIAHVYLRDMVPLRARPLGIFLWHRFIRLFRRTRRCCWGWWFSSRLPIGRASRSTIRGAGITAICPGIS